MDGLVDRLQEGVARHVQANLLPDEQVDVCLQGVGGQALLCTSRRVMIVKAGWRVGQTFGAKVFQAPYAAITSAEVASGYNGAYLEVSAGGTQGGSRSRFSLSTRSNPLTASNCLYFRDRRAAPRFNAAALLIVERADERRRGAA